MTSVSEILAIIAGYNAVVAFAHGVTFGIFKARWEYNPAQDTEGRRHFRVIMGAEASIFTLLTALFSFLSQQSWIKGFG